MKIWKVSEDFSSSSEVESLSDSSHYEINLLMVNEDSDSQMENIFHSKCHVKGKLCSLIIDDSTNLRLVEKLSIPTLVYPRSYKL
ncbi:hypothetical protein CR513_42591, partial [Mucuna pruriens]